MPDWIGYLESHLPLFELDSADRLRVIDELAQEMEGTYEDALRAGASEREAEERAREAVADIDELARRIVLSRRSHRLPAAEVRLQQSEDAARTRRAEGSLTADLLQFFRNGLRTVRRLIRTPSFTFLTILTLALGIGANTAVFTVVDSVLLQPLPYENPSELIQIWFEVPELSAEELNQSVGTYLAIRSEQRTLVDIGLWNQSSATVQDAVGAERVEAMMVSDGTLELLGVRVRAGRLFTAADITAGAPRTVVISHGYWLSRFAGDPGVIGTSLEVHGEVREIIGVLPEGFRFLDRAPALYLPFTIDPARTAMADFSYRALARMMPGLSTREVEEDIRRIIPVMFARYLGSWEEIRLAGAGFDPVIHPLKADIVGDVGAVLWVILGTAGFLLLLACVNAVNLYLVRADGRTREMAVRMALGGGRGTVLREFLTESLLLGLAGGVMGILIARAGLEILHLIHPANIPRLEEIALNGSVLLYSLALSLFCGLFFGLVPAFRLSPRHLFGALREGGRGGTGSWERQRTRSVLVVAQIAMALILLTGSGLMVRTFLAMLSVEPGYRDPRQILTATLSLPANTAPDAESAWRVFDRLVEAVRQVPGVEAASLGYSVPMAWAGSGNYLWVEDAPMRQGEVPPSRENNWITPDYFRSLGTRLLAGREFTAREVEEGRPVAIITQDLALEYWDSPQAAIGRRVKESEDTAVPWKEIVGVVEEIRDTGLGSPPVTMVYWPFKIRDFHGRDTYIRQSAYLTLRSERVGTPGFVDEIRAAAQAAVPGLPLAQVRTMHEIAAESTARTTFTLIILAVAAAVALILGMVGVYGVASCAVSFRSREIGVRMALGAEPGSVRRLVLRQGLALAGTGVVVGLAISSGLTQLMKGLLYGVRPVDLPTFGAVTLLIMLTAAAANLAPAGRAARIDPVRVLSEE